jgi:hypothetical protein
MAFGSARLPPSPVQIDAEGLMADPALGAKAAHAVSGAVDMRSGRPTRGHVMFSRAMLPSCLCEGPCALRGGGVLLPRRASGLMMQDSAIPLPAISIRS